MLSECSDEGCPTSAPAVPAKAGDRGGDVPRMPKRRGPPRPYRQKNQPIG